MTNKSLGAQTTTEDVVEGVDLSGQVAVVTGASGGLGEETARALASRGATVVLAARNPDKVREAAERITASGVRGGIGSLIVDLGSFESIRTAAAELVERHPSINLAILNAGVMAPPLGRTAEGHELQFGTNHLGHFLFTMLLRDSLVAGAPSRVVVLSSAGHRVAGMNWADPDYERTEYHNFTAYGRSKTANALFALEFDRRMAEQGVHAYSVHPGVIMTELSRHIRIRDMDWKRFAVAAGYYGTLPWRQVANRRACEQGAAPICVLFYHRVANSYANDWTISPSLFERQMDWLQCNCDLISLHEAQYRIRMGKNDRPAVCVTFDDGYSDNCNFAIPLLIEREIPCTYFVALDFVLQRIAFPHDVQRGVPLEPNSITQLKQIAADGIEIGAHSRTHADLGQIRDSEILVDEIVTAGRELEHLVEQRINYFAFPYGQLNNLTAAAFRIAREAGYDGVVSAYGGYNFPGDDGFHLQRIHADPEMIRFRNWMTVDPRKVALVEPLRDEVAGMAAPFVGITNGSPIG